MAGPAALMLAAAVLAPANAPQEIGKSPRDVLSPETYRMLSGQDPTFASQLHSLQVQLQRLTDQHGMTVQHFAALSQQVTDLDKQLDVNRGKLETLNPANQIERIVKLEELVRGFLQDQAEEAEASRARWESVSSWLRVLFGCVFAMAGNEAAKRWQARRRERDHQSKLSAIQGEVTALKDNTSELMTAAASSSEEEYARGLADGLARHPHKGA